MSFTEENIDSLESFLEEFVDENYYFVFEYDSTSQELSEEIGTCIGSNGALLEKVITQTDAFSSENRWNFTTIIYHALWHTDKTLHEKAGYYACVIFERYSAEYDTRTDTNTANNTVAKTEDAEAENDLAVLQKKITNDPYGTFFTLQGALPQCNDANKCIQLLLQALTEIENDIDEHSYSNYNAYFTPTDEQEPCYEELVKCQEYYTTLATKLSNGETLNKQELSYCSLPDTSDTPLFTDLEKYSMSQQAPCHSTIKFLSDLFWNTPEQFHPVITDEYQSALAPYAEIKERHTLIELLKAQFGSYDRADIADIFIDEVNSLFKQNESITFMYHFNYICSEILKMPQQKKKVTDCIAHHLAQITKISEVKKWLHYFQEQNIVFLVNHKKAKAAAIKDVKTNITPPALRYLAYFYGTEVAEIFVTHLEHTNSSLVLAVIDGLIQQQQLSAALPAISAALAKSHNEDIYDNVVHNLRNNKDEKVIEMLLPLKQKHVSEAVWDEAFDVYGKDIKPDTQLEHDDDFETLYEELCDRFDIDEKFEQFTGNNTAYQATLAGLTNYIIANWDGTVQ